MASPFFTVCANGQSFCNACAHGALYGNRLALFLVAALRADAVFVQCNSAERTSGVYLAEPVADVIAVTFTAILFAVQFKKALRPLEKKTDAS